MIPRLNYSSLNFRANQSVSPREAYDSQMLKNSQTAQKQNQAAANAMSANNAKNANKIPMQGSGQKLDIIA